MRVCTTLVSRVCRRRRNSGALHARRRRADRRALEIPFACVPSRGRTYYGSANLVRDLSKVPKRTAGSNSQCVGLIKPYDVLPLAMNDSKDVFAPTRDPLCTLPTQLGQGAEPPLLMTGNDDTKVKPARSISRVRRVRKIGSHPDLMLYPGAVTRISCSRSPRRGDDLLQCRTRFRGSQPPRHGGSLACAGNSPDTRPIDAGPA